MVTPRALRVLFFGTPGFAVPSLAHLIASRHEVVSVVTQPDRPRGRGQQVTPCPVKVLALEHGIPVMHPDSLSDAEFLAHVQSLGTDIGVVAAYGRILPQMLLDTPPLGLINVHASLLPRWRGAAPIHRSVMAGDPETGITIMRVVRALDAGPMLRKVSTPIHADDTSETLETRLADLGGTLLVDTLDALASGPHDEEPQDSSAVTYASKLERAESRIDWTLPASVIDRRVRGLQPWPLAVAQWAGKGLALLEVRPDDAGAIPAGVVPGQVLAVSGDAISIACGTGVLHVTRVKPEGRRPMAVRDFLNGTPVPAGVVLT